MRTYLPLCFLLLFACDVAQADPPPGYVRIEDVALFGLTPTQAHSERMRAECWSYRLTQMRWWYLTTGQEDEYGQLASAARRSLAIWEDADLIHWQIPEVIRLPRLESLRRALGDRDYFTGVLPLAVPEGVIE